MISVPGPAAAPAPLRVLEGHRPPAPGVAYVDQIVGDGSGGIDFHFFRGKLPRRSADVVHVQQLDGLLGGRRIGGRARMFNAVAVARALRSRRMGLVQTVHGVREGGFRGRADRFAAILLDRLTTTFVVLDEATETPDPDRTVLIPYAHHRERFLGYPRSDMVPGRLVCVSPTKLGGDYAGVVRVLAVTDTPGLSLRIVGKTVARLEDAITSAVARVGDRISVFDGRASDGAKVLEITASELVVFPSVGTFSELSMLFLALSLDRPAIVPDTDMTRRLAAEVGEGWVLLHSGPLTAEKLDRLVAESRAVNRSASPDLDRRAPEAIAAKYAEVFEAARRARGR